MEKHGGFKRFQLGPSLLQQVNTHVCQQVVNQEFSVMHQPEELLPEDQGKKQ